MVIFTVNWTAQESTSYALGTLSAHRTMAGAVSTLAATIESLNIFWRRTDGGMSPDQMRETPPQSRQDLHRYRATFIQMDEGMTEARRMELEIKQLNVAN